jgi:hypothetical protein
MLKTADSMQVQLFAIVEKSLCRSGFSMHDSNITEKSGLRHGIFIQINPDCGIVYKQLKYGESGWHISSDIQLYYKKGSHVTCPF